MVHQTPSNFLPRLARLPYTIQGVTSSLPSKSWGLDAACPIFVSRREQILKIPQGQQRRDR